MDYEIIKNFLFDTTKEMKLFYETPVVFVTRKDFSDSVFNTLSEVLNNLTENQDRDKLMDIIVDFHLQWLHAVNDVETFRTALFKEHGNKDIREAICFTIEAMNNRLMHFQRYMDKHKSTLLNTDHAYLITDLELVEEMHKSTTACLSDKTNCFLDIFSQEEIKIKLNDLIEELLNWLDRIYDGLAQTLSNYTNFNLPSLSGDLTKTLQDIVEELQSSRDPSTQRLLKELKGKGKEFGTITRSTSLHNLEISKVTEKINILQDRIVRLENESSSAVMALKHKKEFLERRLLSLENIKTTLKNISDKVCIPFEELSNEELCSYKDFYQLNIFNHLLPPADRERLVTELCYLWDKAVHGQRSHKSIISILSAADMKEEYTDELGTYYIDRHSRKIYKKVNDEILYQPNEKHELVPLTDDVEHIYFYDECGRYFIDANTRQRIYKADATASEYMMDSMGILLKIKEEYNGVIYYYDNYGRYYINTEGKHIYQEEGATSEYENDGLGNLVRIRSHLDILEPCPDDVEVTEEFRYLKQTVGSALRECIADVIVHQPVDPIKYLSLSLIKYRENKEIQDKRSLEKDLLKAEREIRLNEEKDAAEKYAMENASRSSGGSEESSDSNFLKYRSMHPDDFP